MLLKVNKANLKAKADSTAKKLKVDATPKL